MNALTPRPIVATYTQVDHTAHAVIESVSIVDKPLVAEISERFLRDEFTVGFLKLHGYRMADRYLDRRTQLWVRPLPLWLVIRTRVRASFAFWRAMRWAYGHGVFHLASPEGMLFRWRDVRPGRGLR